MDSACGQRILSHSPGPNMFFDPTGLYGNMSIYSSVRPSIEQDGPLRRRLRMSGIAVPTVLTRILLGGLWVMSWACVVACTGGH